MTYYSCEITSFWTYNSPTISMLPCVNMDVYGAILATKHLDTVQWHHTDRTALFSFTGNRWNGAPKTGINSEATSWEQSSVDRVSTSSTTASDLSFWMILEMEKRRDFHHAVL